MNLTLAHYKSYFLSLVRDPMKVIVTILLPLLMYFVFAADKEVPAQQATFIAISFMTYAVLGVSYSQVGVDMVQLRNNPWLDYIKTLPNGLNAFIRGRIAISMTFALLCVSAMYALANLCSSLDLNMEDLFKIVIVLLMGSIPFALLAATVALWLPRTLSMPMNQFMYLPMCYLGGLWVPPQNLPQELEKYSLMMPTRHLGEICWSIYLKTDIPYNSVLFLLGLTLICGLTVGLRFSKRFEHGL